MSKRLQVLMDPKEYRKFSQIARRSRMSLGEWVRQTLRKASNETSSRPPEDKLEALTRSLKNQFPTGSLKEMNEEIQSGYLSQSDRP